MNLSPRAALVLIRHHSWQVLNALSTQKVNPSSSASAKRCPSPAGVAQARCQLLLPFPLVYQEMAAKSHLTFDLSPRASVCRRLKAALRTQAVPPRAAGTRQSGDHIQKKEPTAVDDMKSDHRRSQSCPAPPVRYGWGFP